MIDDPFTMVVLIVLIVMTSVVLMVRLNTQARRALAQPSGHNAALEAEVARLKERVAVLERIATDKDHLLEREFEALRLPTTPTRAPDVLHG